MVIALALLACVPDPGASPFDPDHDWDGDGVSEAEGDCDDADPAVSPLATEVCSTPTDEDCDAETRPCAVIGEMSVQDGDTSFTERWEDDGWPVAAGGDLSGDGTVWAVTGGLGGTIAGAWRFVPDGDRMRAEGVWLGTAASPGLVAQAAGAGDADGDGVGDLLVSAANAFGVDSGLGGVFLTIGPLVEDHRDLAVDPHTCELRGPDGASAGLAMGSAGDMDGDGDDELLIGGPTGIDRAGTVWWVAGDPGWGGCADTYRNLTDVASGEWQGASLETFGAGSVTVGLGDVDGDGLDDVGVGTISGRPGGGMDAYVILGASGGLTGTRPLGDVADAIYRTARDGSVSMYPIALAPMGDLDGDGRADIALGTAGDLDAYEAGAAWIVVGSPLGDDLALSDTAHVEIDGPDVVFGTRVSAGDLDGDGIPDLLVGSPEEEHDTLVDAGAAYVFLGSDLRDGGERYADQDAFAAVRGSTDYGRLGKSLAFLGDVDADGTHDFAVGELSGSDGTTWLFLGGS